MAGNSETETKSVMKINVTNEQREAIRQFFGHFDWTLEEITDSDVPENNDVGNNNDNANTDTDREENSDPVTQHDDDDTQDGAVGHIPDDVCAHCFCNPCVTGNPQAWLGNGQNPHPRNSGIRKKIYKKKLMSDRNAFNCPQYLRKKARMLARDQIDDSVVTVSREIMPDCVLSVVRNLYPNPPSQPYMGHKWL